MALNDLSLDNTDFQRALFDEFPFLIECDVCGVAPPKSNPTVWKEVSDFAMKHELWYKCTCQRYYRLQFYSWQLQNVMDLMKFLRDPETKLKRTQMRPITDPADPTLIIQFEEVPRIEKINFRQLLFRAHQEIDDDDTKQP